VKLLGDLTAGLAAPNNQDRTVWKARALRIGFDIDLEKVRGKRACGIGTVGFLVSAGAEYDPCRFDVARRRVQAEASPLDWVERRHLDVFSERGVAAERIALEEADDLVALIERIRIFAVVKLIGKLHAPVRCHEAEALPTPPPGLPYPPLLEHDMRNAVLGELMTGCKPGLTGTHNHDIEGITHRANLSRLEHRLSLSTLPEDREIAAQTAECQRMSNALSGATSEFAG